MQSIIFCLMMPVLPILIYRLYNKEKELSVKEIFARYFVYAMIMTFLSTCAMVFMCDEGTSFLDKMDRSSSFVIKYVLIEAVAGILVAGAEWFCTARKAVIQVDWEGYRQYGPIKLIRKLVMPAGLFLLAAVVILMNVSLMFDNVLWGDEAFSANTVKNTFAGIMQIITLEDNHPPLYYFWLKLFGGLFGQTGPVYHLASLVPFILGILLAVTAFRKHFGNIPAAFFIIISGLAAPCLEYNLEVRMYSLAFMWLAGGYYCVYRVLSSNKILPWIGMVICILAAAYTHYYALVAGAIMLLITSVAVTLKYKGKTWIKGVVSLVVFFVGYLPWLRMLIHSTEDVSGNWWMTETISIKDSMTMILGGESISKIVLLMLVGICIVLFFAESSLFQINRKEEDVIVKVYTPKIAKWSDETYTIAVGILTIAGTLIFAYLLCALIGPILAVRYVYPLIAITAIMLVIGCSRLLAMLEKMDETTTPKWAKNAGKCVLVLLLVVLTAKGLNNFQSYRATVQDEKQKTEATLALIGETGEGVQLVNNGVTHIGWTVLQYYYPDLQVVNGSYQTVADCNDFWYFSNGFLTESDLKALAEQGYELGGYGKQQISKYPFILYHMFRTTAPAETAPMVTTAPAVSAK